MESYTIMRTIETHICERRKKTTDIWNNTKSYLIIFYN